MKKPALTHREEGYPTASDLQRIATWPETNLVGLLEFVRSIWWAADWGFRRWGKTYWLSTGGWSGNEEIISVLQHHFCWFVAWQSSRRGGHHKLRLP